MTMQASTLPEHVPPRQSTTGEWTAFWRFVRKPTMPAPGRAPIGRAASGIARMVLLDYLLMIALMLVAGALVAAGVPMPESDLVGADWDAMLIVFALVLAPLGEEFVFRGWLTGRPALVWSTLALVAGGLGAVLFAGTPVLAGVLVLAGILAALLAAIFMWKRPRYEWSPRVFKALFWTSTLAFALVHLTNYSEGSLLALLPFVLPQFIGGTIFGYVRVHYGLWASVIVHALHNSVVVAIALSAMSAAERAGGA
ncbi:CPBP family intramembrane glutamic endopeptidase [Qipengyuania sp. JC766]|uniref:CPBP family intramembrane glutamic endopeptidase n=1 Tax=Qipengyuania sp. JC766 TaxID=3232139 RepID=UPI00345B01F9